MLCSSFFFYRLTVHNLTPAQAVLTVGPRAGGIGPRGVPCTLRTSGNQLPYR